MIGRCWFKVISPEWGTAAHQHLLAAWFAVNVIGVTSAEKPLGAPSAFDPHSKIPQIGKARRLVLSVSIIICRLTGYWFQGRVV